MHDLALLGKKALLEKQIENISLGKAFKFTNIIDVEKLNNFLHSSISDSLRIISTKEDSKKSFRFG